MENSHAQINDLTRYEVDTKRTQRLERKQQPKTKAQRLKGWYWFLLGLGGVCQLLSALLASSGVLYHVNTKLNSKGFIVFVIVGLLLLALEGAKRFANQSFHEQRLDDGEVQKVTYIGMAILTAVSVYSTYAYTEYAVQYYSASPIYVSIDSIESHYDTLLSNDKSVLQAELLAHNETAKDIKSRSSWKGRISRDSRPAYMAAVTAAKDVEIKLSDISILRQDEKLEAIDAANYKNEQIEANHIAWCGSFGSSLALASILFEFLFFFTYWWCAGFERLEVSEGKVIRKMQLEHLQTDTDNGTDNKKKRLPDTETNINTARTVITPFATAKASLNRTCNSCGTDITNKRSDAKFCSTKCRTSHHKNKLK